MSTTGVITSTLHIQDYRGILRCHVARLDLPCDLIVGESWMRKHRASVIYGLEGARAVTLFKGRRKISLVPIASRPIHSASTIKISAMQMKKQMKSKSVLKCFVVKVKPLGDPAKGAPSEKLSQRASPTPEVPNAPSQSFKQTDQPRTDSSDTPLVPDSVMTAIKEEFSDVFEPPPPGLPPDRGIGHMIPLQPDHKPPYRQPYRLSPLEIAEVKKQIAHLLAQGWIEESKSPYGASILFVQKNDGTLRMCVDYRALNNLTVKDRSPLPRIDDLLAQMSGATVFSSLDLAQGYHQIRIAEEDIPKTGFTTAFGHYHYNAWWPPSAQAQLGLRLP